MNTIKKQKFSPPARASTVPNGKFIKLINNRRRDAVCNAAKNFEFKIERGKRSTDFNRVTERRAKT